MKFGPPSSFFFDVPRALQPFSLAKKKVVGTLPLPLYFQIHRSQSNRSQCHSHAFVFFNCRQAGRGEATVAFNHSKKGDDEIRHGSNKPSLWVHAAKRTIKSDRESFYCPILLSSPPLDYTMVRPRGGERGGGDGKERREET